MVALGGVLFCNFLGQVFPNLLAYSRFNYFVRKGISGIKNTQYM